jgi:hypothetical protein
MLEIRAEQSAGANKCVTLGQVAKMQYNEKKRNEYTQIHLVLANDGRGEP